MQNNAISSFAAAKMGDRLVHWLEGKHVLHGLDVGHGSKIEHFGIGRHASFMVQHAHIAVTDAAVFHLNLDVVGAQIIGLALERL